MCTHTHSDTRTRTHMLFSVPLPRFLKAGEIGDRGVSVSIVVWVSPLFFVLFLFLTHSKAINDQI